jgi:hypothetical protein
MRRVLITLILVLSVGSTAYGQQECKDPDIRATFREKYTEIGTSHPDFLQDATIILNKSSFQKTQWVGLYWEGPVSGALLAYDCSGKLLSIQRMGGVKSVEFFSVPRTATPAVAVEDIWTGTGYYKIGYTIYSLSSEKISKLWEHTKLERNFQEPGKDGIVDLFEISRSGFADPGWRKLTVEGVRKIYPSTKDSYSNFRIDKLPTESYCWDHEKYTYSVCK